MAALIASSSASGTQFGTAIASAPWLIAVRTRFAASGAEVVVGLQLQVVRRAAVASTTVPASSTPFLMTAQNGSSALPPTTKMFAPSCAMAPPATAERPPWP